MLYALDRAGGALGVATGIVVGGFQSSSPPMGYPGAPPPPSMTAIEALKDTGEMMMNKSKSWSKNFAKVGAIYSTVECVLEKGRAQHDMQNSVYAGCITGAALAYKQGPLAMAMGCGGFAAFSVAIGKLTLLQHYFRKSVVRSCVSIFCLQKCSSLDISGFRISLVTCRKGHFHGPGLWLPRGSIFETSPELNDIWR